MFNLVLRNLFYYWEWQEGIDVYFSIINSTDWDLNRLYDKLNKQQTVCTMYSVILHVMGRIAWVFPPRHEHSSVDKWLAGRYWLLKPKCKISTYNPKKRRIRIIYEPCAKSKENRWKMRTTMNVFWGPWCLLVLWKFVNTPL